MLLLLRNEPECQPSLPVTTPSICFNELKLLQSLHCCCKSLQKPSTSSNSRIADVALSRAGAAAAIRHCFRRAVMHAIRITHVSDFEVDFLLKLINSSRSFLHYDRIIVGGHPSLSLEKVKVSCVCRLAIWWKTHVFVAIVASNDPESLLGTAACNIHSLVSFHETYTRECSGTRPYWIRITYQWSLDVALSNRGILRSPLVLGWNRLWRFLV